MSLIFWCTDLKWTCIWQFLANRPSQRLHWMFLGLKLCTLDLCSFNKFLFVNDLPQSHSCFEFPWILVELSKQFWITYHKNYTLGFWTSLHELLEYVFVDKLCYITFSHKNHIWILFSSHALLHSVFVTDFWIDITYYIVGKYVFEARASLAAS